MGTDEIKRKRLKWPVGLYVPLKDKFSEIENIENRNDLWTTLRGLTNKFNNKYPGFQFGISQISYTGRARLIDIDKLSPLEAEHISGCVLPGMHSSLYYILPEKIVNNLHSSNMKFIGRLIKFSSTVHPDVFPQDIETFIKSSGNILKKTKTDLELVRKLGTMRRIWNRKKPNLKLCTDEQIKKILDAIILDNISNEHIISLAIAMYFFMLLLMLRPCEIKKIDFASSISFYTKSLIISAKGNQIYTESRAIPVPPMLLKLLECITDRYNLKNPADENGKSAKKEIEESISLLRRSMRNSGVDDYDLGCYRRFSASRIYNMKGSKIPFMVLEAIMGHSQIGFEVLGPFSRIQFQAMRTWLEKYELIWKDEIFKAQNVLLKKK